MSEEFFESGDSIELSINSGCDSINLKAKELCWGRKNGKESVIKINAEECQSLIDVLSQHLNMLRSIENIAPNRLKSETGAEFVLRKNRAFKELNSFLNLSQESLDGIGIQSV